MSKQSLIFFGNECLSSSLEYNDCPIFSKLIEDGWLIESLIIKDRPNRSRKKRSYRIVEMANRQKILIKIANSSSQLTDIFHDNQFQSKTAVLAAFGLILPQIVFEQFPKSVINVHPSLLPQDRGSTPIETAILNNYQTAGVSLMKVAPALDSGPVYCQSSIPIEANLSKLELTKKLANLAADLLVANLDQIVAGQLTPVDQDSTLATYSKKLTKSMSLIDWNCPAEEIERKVRAHLDWPSSRAVIKGQTVIIWQSKVVKFENRAPIGQCWFDKNNRLIVVQTGSGQLGISLLQVLNRKIISAQDFYNSYF